MTDTSWLVDGTTSAVPVPPECSPRPWTQLHPAQWIWRAACSAVDREASLFLRKFVLPAVPSFARIEILADDYAYVSINDESLPNLCTLEIGPQTYGPAAVCGYREPLVRDVRALLRVGENTIRIMVHNAASSSSTERNPAGLLARLTLGSGAPE